MTFAHFFKGIFMLTALLALVSCGGGRPQIVTGLSVIPETTAEGDVQLRLNASMDFGNIQFPSASFPVMHPQGNRQIGEVALIPALGGKTQLSVMVNISEIAGLAASQAYLPNGGLVPLIATNPALTINLGRGTRLYIVASQQAFAVGVAIPISGLDSMGAVGTVSFFPTFAIDRAVGAAGLFTSKTAGQNGLGFFADVTPYVQGLQWNKRTSNSSLAVAMKAAIGRTAQNTTIRLDYSEKIPSKSVENKINDRLYDMHRKRVKLKL